MLKAVVLLAVVATAQSANISRHLKLLPELENDIGPDALPNEEIKKFVALTGRPSNVVFHKAGTPLELTCEGIGRPAPNVRWFKNDAPVYERNLESNEIIDTNPTSLARVTSTLLIPRTEGEDVYVCVVSSGFKSVKASTTVYNLDGSTSALSTSEELWSVRPLVPKILVYYKVFVDTIGNNITLPCKVRGHPRPHVTWKDNNGKVIKKDRRMKVLRTGELVISSLRWSDMGEFACIAENAFGSQNVTTFVYPAKAG